MTHICVSKLTLIGLDNGLSPGRRQVIIWTNAGILLSRTLGTNFSEIWSEIHTFSSRKCFENVVCELASNLSRPQCEWTPTSIIWHLMTVLWENSVCWRSSLCFVLHLGEAPLCWKKMSIEYCWLAILQTVSKINQFVSYPLKYYFVTVETVEMRMQGVIKSFIIQLFEVSLLRDSYIPIFPW